MTEPWTLWRGDALLGALHERDVPPARHITGERARHVNAVLVPDPSCLPLPSVVQHVSHLGGKRRVIERAWDRDAAPDRMRDRGRSGATGAWVAKLEPGEPPSVPVDQQLSVRDETGRIVGTRSVSVLEHRPDSEHLPAELSTFPAGTYVNGSLWLVSFTEEAGAPVR